MSQRERKTVWKVVWLVLLAGAGIVGAARVLAQSGVPRPDHLVMVIEENHSSSQIIGSAAAPYMNALAQQGALFTASFAITHPSEPNYLALFSGSTQGVSSDNCPYSFTDANLGSELIAAGLTFGGYSEDMPSVGYTGCTYRKYARKHNPWVNWQGVSVPAEANMPLTSFPTDFGTLPTVSIVIPNLNDDMHDGTVKQADTWLQQHLAPYVQWAMMNNSLLIVTWDEDEGSNGNRIPTFFVGPMVKTGQYAEKIDHYSVLRTIEEMYTLSAAGKSAAASPITDVWSTQAQHP